MTLPYRITDDQEERQRFERWLLRSKLTNPGTDFRRIQQSPYRYGDPLVNLRWEGWIGAVNQAKKEAEEKAAEAQGANA